MQYLFHQITPTPEDWELIEGAYDSSCFQSRKWYEYFKRIGISPFIVAIYKANEKIGYFIGEKRWLGIPSITAPIEGVGTYTQGLNMLAVTQEETRIEIYQTLAQWVFKKHIALTMQVDDWHLRRDTQKWIPLEEFHHDSIENYKIPYDIRPTLYINLNKSEEELWAGLHYKSCKYSVNKATRLGLKVREINQFNEISTFCRLHYDQLYEVCMRKGELPKPSQSIKRMQALCESLFPDRVMMLEVIGKDENEDEKIMSSGIFCIDKGQCSYWTGASYQRYQKYCPNELMVWEAMKRISQRGGGDLNFGGMASYKLKFGTIYAYVPRLRFAKYSILLNYTARLKKTYYFCKHHIIEPVYKILSGKISIYI